MRILLCGAHQTGKSALADSYRRISPKIGVIPEIAREIITREGADVIQRPEFQDMLFAEQVRREYEMAKRISDPRDPLMVMIADRSIVDNIVYSVLLGKRFPKKSFR
ncbi:MAG TPA: hypothetical protein ENI23_14980 [bacterium]|nr:hypothetical protein [bacterium]